MLSPAHREQPRHKDTTTTGHEVDEPSLLPADAIKEGKPVHLFSAQAPTDRQAGRAIGRRGAFVR